jgi:hypothetical protein
MGRPRIGLKLKQVQLCRANEINNEPRKPEARAASACFLARASLAKRPSGADLGRAAPTTVTAATSICNHQHLSRHICVYMSRSLVPSAKRFNCATTTTTSERASSKQTIIVPPLHRRPAFTFAAAVIRLRSSTGRWPVAFGRARALSPQSGPAKRIVTPHTRQLANSRCPAGSQCTGFGGLVFINMDFQPPTAALHLQAVDPQSAGRCAKFAARRVARTKSEQVATGIKSSRDYAK